MKIAIHYSVNVVKSEAIAKFKAKKQATGLRQTVGRSFGGHFRVSINFSLMELKDRKEFTSARLQKVHFQAKH